MSDLFNVLIAKHYFVVSFTCCLKVPFTVHFNNRGQNAMAGGCWIGLQNVPANLNSNDANSEKQGKTFSGFTQNGSKFIGGRTIRVGRILKKKAFNPTTGEK